MNVLGVVSLWRWGHARSGSGNNTVDRKRCARERTDNFQRKVIEPAVLEVNGLSDMGVRVEMVRRHARAPVAGVTICWWKKSGDEFRAAIEERHRSKVGRMARLRQRAGETMN